MRRDEVLRPVEAETKSSRGISFIHVLGAFVGAGLALLAMRRFFGVKRIQETAQKSPEYIELPGVAISEEPQK